MKVDEFKELIAKFRDRTTLPVGGQRHMYIWHGELTILEAALSPVGSAHLDLHDLARSLERRPDDSHAANQVLERAIESWLQRCKPDTAPSQIIVVSGCDLLMRYRVAMAPFMRALDDESVMVLVVPPYLPPSAPLPRDVEFRLYATFGYLREFISEQAVIEL